MATPPARDSRRDYMVLSLLTRRRRTEGRSTTDRLRLRARRRATRLIVMATLTSLLMSEIYLTAEPKSVWVRQRSVTWWEDVVLHTFQDHDWLENFRVSKVTFQYLCQQLRPAIAKKNTVMRNSISVDRRVAITLWVLATTSEYRSVGHLFGVARNTVGVIVHETCVAIVEILLPMYIQFPSGSELTRVIDGFKSNFGVPQCAGSIDGSHVPVTPPAMNHTDYYNRKGWYSMLVQAVVDHELLFRNLCIGWPGSVHDARVFTNSSVYTKIKTGQFLTGNVVQLQGHSVKPFLVGDSAYPLLPFLIKPYSFSTSMSQQTKKFNYCISCARVVVEIAFGRLKARWRRLSKKIDMDINNVPHIITACCVLHNVCEIHHDNFNDVWLQELGTQLAQPDSVSTSSVHSSSAATHAEGEKVCDILMEYFNNN